MSGFGSSLRSRIAAVVGLLFMTGIGLVTLVVTSILHDEMQELVSQQQQTAASYIARDIDSKVTLRLESLKRVALNMPPALFADRPALQRWLEDRKAIHTLFPTGMLIIPPDGGPPLADVPHLDSRPKSFGQRDWFIGATTTRAPYISQPLVARATGEAALVVAIPIFDQQQLLGVLAGVTPLAAPGFLELIRGARPDRLGSYQLISPRHRLFVLGTENRQAVAPLPAAGEDPIIDAALGGRRGVGILRNAEGEDELATIVDIPRPGWLLIARQPGSEAFRAVWNTVRNSLLVSLLIALPCLLILLAALRRLFNPMARLAREIHEMAEGTRPVQAVETLAADEVAQVASSFNRLQEKLLEQERRLAEMAHHDTLTGLPNRLLITDRLNHELQRIARNGNGLALLFLDLDAFKPVNDQYGHHVGDLLLVDIAKRLRNHIRDADTVARLGGDEFLILLGDTATPLDGARRAAEECIEALKKPFRIEDRLINVGVSIGIAICEAGRNDSPNAVQLLGFADLAMYRAKAAGGNRYALYDPTLPPAAAQEPQPT